jgi:hypothetical protein
MSATTAVFTAFVVHFGDPPIGKQQNGIETPEEMDKRLTPSPISS